METAVGTKLISSLAGTRHSPGELLKAVWKGKTGHLALVALSWVAGLALWELVGRLSSPFVFAGFSDSVAALWRITENGILLHHTLVTMRELVVAFLLGATIGIAGGTIAGFSPTFRTMTDHWVTIILAVPFAAVFPLFLVWFGLQEASKIALGAFACFLTVWINTYTGVISVDRHLTEVPRAFGGTWFQVVRWIVLPWSLPFVVEGLRMGLSRAFLGVVIGELLAADAGLGYFIGLAGGTLRMDNLMAGVMVVTGITVVLVELMKTFQRAIVPWWEERD
jgi:NitT/TauT family transport system permease protein